MPSGLAAAILAFAVADEARASACFEACESTEEDEGTADVVGREGGSRKRSD